MSFDSSISQTIIQFLNPKSIGAVKSRSNFGQNSIGTDSVEVATIVCAQGVRKNEHPGYQFRMCIYIYIIYKNDLLLVYLV